jgi:hypothetical protein
MHGFGHFHDDQGVVFRLVGLIPVQFGGLKALAWVRPFLTSIDASARISLFS